MTCSIGLVVAYFIVVEGHGTSLSVPILTSRLMEAPESLSGPQLRSGTGASGKYRLSAANCQVSMGRQRRVHADIGRSEVCLRCSWERLRRNVRESLKRSPAQRFTTLTLDKQARPLQGHCEERSVQRARQNFSPYGGKKGRGVKCGGRQATRRSRSLTVT